MCLRCLLLDCLVKLVCSSVDLLASSLVFTLSFTLCLLKLLLRISTIRIELLLNLLRLGPCLVRLVVVSMIFTTSYAMLYEISEIERNVHIAELLRAHSHNPPRQPSSLLCRNRAGHPSVSWLQSRHRLRIYVSAWHE